MDPDQPLPGQRPRHRERAASADDDVGFADLLLCRRSVWLANDPSGNLQRRGGALSVRQSPSGSFFDLRVPGGNGPAFSAAFVRVLQLAQQLRVTRVEASRLLPRMEGNLFHARVEDPISV